MQVARKIGLTAKLVRMAWSRLGGLGQTLPAMLVLRNGEAVILSGIRQDAEKTEVVVRDLLATNQGFQFWDRAKLEEVWGGELILIKRKYALADTSQPFSLKWFIPEFLRHRRAFGDVIVAALTLHALALASPIFFQRVDQGLWRTLRR